MLRPKYLDIAVLLIGCIINNSVRTFAIPTTYPSYSGTGVPASSYNSDGYNLAAPANGGYGPPNTFELDDLEPASAPTYTPQQMNSAYGMDTTGQTYQNSQLDSSAPPFPVPEIPVPPGQASGPVSGVPTGDYGYSNPYPGNGINQQAPYSSSAQAPASAPGPGPAPNTSSYGAYSSAPPHASGPAPSAYPAPGPQPVSGTNSYGPSGSPQATASGYNSLPAHTPTTNAGPSTVPGSIHQQQPGDYGYSNPYPGNGINQQAPYSSSAQAPASAPGPGPAPNTSSYGAYSSAPPHASGPAPSAYPASGPQPVSGTNSYGPSGSPQATASGYNSLPAHTPTTNAGPSTVPGSIHQQQPGNNAFNNVKPTSANIQPTPYSNSGLAPTSALGPGPMPNNTPYTGSAPAPPHASGPAPSTTYNPSPMSSSNSYPAPGYNSIPGQPPTTSAPPTVPGSAPSSIHPQQSTYPSTASGNTAYPPAQSTFNNSPASGTMPPNGEYAKNLKNFAYKMKGKGTKTEKTERRTGRLISRTITLENPIDIAHVDELEKVPYVQDEKHRIMKINPSEIREPFPIRCRYKATIEPSTAKPNIDYFNITSVHFIDGSTTSVYHCDETQYSKFFVIYLSTFNVKDKDLGEYERYIVQTQTGGGDGYRRIRYNDINPKMTIQMTQTIDLPFSENGKGMQSNSTVPPKRPVQNSWPQNYVNPITKFHDDLRRNIDHVHNTFAGMQPLGTGLNAHDQFFQAHSDLAARVLQHHQQVQNDIMGNWF